MEAKELRIGNYYKHNGDIKQITPNIILEVWESKRIWCKPIPLNEEWLLKFGFKTNINKDSGCGYSYINDFSIWVDNGKLIYWKVKGSVELEHVHQLQNLYFSLTGEELTLSK